MRKFIRDFLHIENNLSGRIYRTGDLGRIDENGEIEYRGRIDTQVKIRGYRIELNEIQAVLLNLPQVVQAAVTTFEPEEGVVEIVAYYVLKQGAEQPRNEISLALRGKLPVYMVPAFLEQVDAIPMTLSNKVDYKRLPKPQSRRFSTAQGYVPPKNDRERMLQAALARVLHVERVSTEHHFFNDLGAPPVLLYVARFERTAVALAPTARAARPTAAAGRPAGRACRRSGRRSATARRAGRPAAPAPRSPGAARRGASVRPAPGSLPPAASRCSPRSGRRSRGAHGDHDLQRPILVPRALAIASRNAARSRSSRQTVNVSSNWSIASTAGASISVRSSSVRGRGPGRISAWRQWSEPGSTPSARAGSSPARSADDLPLPDGPITASGAPTSRATSSATSRSRPKKYWRGPRRTWRARGTADRRRGRLAAAVAARALVERSQAEQVAREVGLGRPQLAALARGAPGARPDRGGGALTGPFRGEAVRGERDASVCPRQRVGRERPVVEPRDLGDGVGERAEDDAARRQVVQQRALVQHDDGHRARQPEGAVEHVAARVVEDQHPRVRGGRRRGVHGHAAARGCAGELLREQGLADAARAGDERQPAGVEQRHQLGELVVAAGQHRRACRGRRLGRERRVLGEDRLVETLLQLRARLDADLLDQNSVWRAPSGTPRALPPGDRSGRARASTGRAGARAAVGA